MQKITLVLDQIKTNIKDDIWRCHQHIVQKHHTSYIFISSKILQLIIYCFNICIFFYQRSSHFKLDTCSPLGNWVSRSLIWASSTLKLIAQLTLALIYGIFLNSAVPTYLTSQPTLVTNAYINKSLFTYEITRKITSVGNSIPSKHLKFTSRCLKSSLTHWVNIRIESSEAFSVCYKQILYVLKVVRKNIYFSSTIFHLIFIKVWLLLI